MSRLFYLVQRMTAEDGARGGFDRFFRLDYMGAAEFEFGALPKSLDRIRATRDLVTGRTYVAVGDKGQTVYIIGDRKQVQAAKDGIQEWVDGGCYGHERPYFAEHIAGTATDYMERTNAWWSITDDVMFTLDVDIAKRIVSAINGGAA